MVGFEWDPQKNHLNISKHGIDFADVVELFDGPYLEGLDDRVEYGEERMIVYGEMDGQVVAVVYTWRDQRRRIISARKVTTSETRLFYEVVHGEK